MNIAIVGGGKRCKYLLDLIDRHSFFEILPHVVAVADIDDHAPGFVRAREKGLMVTNDYSVFFDRRDIDLIIELTGNMDVYNDILARKKKNVHAIASPTARLFWEISRMSSQQQKYRQKLQKTRAMYDVVINELIQEDVLVIATDYRILDVNETLLEKLGLRREEVIGRPCYEITHKQRQPCSGDEHPCPLIQTVRTQESSRVTHVHRGKDNREMYDSISTYPLFEGGQLIGAIEISRDITRDINLQKVMMQQEKLASIGRLSAGVAHEINNPLTTILTTAILIQEDLDPDDPTHAELGTIASETLRCRKIVTSLLDFARQTKPAKKPLDLNQILSESVVLTKKQAAFNDILIICELGESLPIIEVDKGQIQQAIINLAINAMEAAGTGGKVTLSTRWADDRRAIEILVSDDGCGILPEHLDRIIDPFFTTKDDGTGLGLAITHGIVEQHGGDLDVVSDPGEGSTFIVRLPLEQESADAP